MKKSIIRLLIVVILFIGVNLTSVYAAKAVNTTAQTETQTIETTQSTTVQEEQKNQNNNGMGLIAVALATGLACIGAGIAVATVGASAVGAISENPKLLGKTIIFAGLAEGIAIYGLIISIMILDKI